MNLREASQKAARQLLAAESPSWQRRIMRSNYHILPVSAVEQVFDDLPMGVLAVYAPYIPPRLYSRIPRDGRAYPELRPLVYTRPAAEIWGRRITDGMPLHERRLYAMWQGAKQVRWREAISRPFFYLWSWGGDISVRRLNRFMRVAHTREAVRAAVFHHFLARSFRTINHRLLASLLDKYGDEVGWKTLCRYVYDGMGHYKVLIRAFCVLMRRTGPVIPSAFACLRTLRRGKLFLRMPSYMRAQIYEWFRHELCVSDAAQQFLALLSDRDLRLLPRIRVYNTILHNV